MAVELATAYVSLVPSAGGIRGHLTKELSGLDSEASGAGDRLGKNVGGGFASSFGALAVAAVAAIGAAKIGGFLKDAVGAASDLGETTSKAAMIFGQEAIPALQKFASTSADTMGQSSLQALDAATTFAVFGKSAGLTGDKLVDFSTDMVSLAGDMASFGNSTPEEAIESIGAALRGEAEPIRKYGILLDDATLRNRALKLGIISSTKDALTPANKVLAAQAEIMEQTKDAQGDFARTSGGLANQQRILAARLENLKGVVGNALLPVVSAFVGFLITGVLPVLDKVAQAVGPVMEGAIAIGARAIDFIREHWEVFVGLLGGPVVGGAIIAIAHNWETVRDRLAAVWVDLRGGFLSFVNAWTAADGDITSSGWHGQVEAIAYRLRTLWDEATVAVQGFRDRLTDALPEGGMVAATEAVKGNLQAAAGFAKDNQDALIVGGGGAAAAAGGFTAVSKAGSTLSTVGKTLAPIMSALASVVAVVATAGAALLTPFVLIPAIIIGVAAAAFLAYQRFEPFRNLVNLVARAVADFAMGALAWLQDAFWSLARGVQGVVGAIMGVLRPLWGWIDTNVISTIAAGLDFLKAVWGVVAGFIAIQVTIIQAVLSVLAPIVMAVVDAIVTVLGILISVAWPIVKAWADLVWQYVSFAFDVVKNVVEAVLGVIRGILQVATGLLTGDWQKAWDGLVTIVTSVLGNLWDIISGIPGRILNILGTVGTLLVDLGGQLIQGMVTGVSNIIGRLWDIFTFLPGTILGQLAGIGSWLYDAGRDLIQGMVNGVKDMAGNIADAAKDVVGGAIDAAKGILHIGSPSRLFHQFGVWTMEGLVEGIQAERPALVREMAGVTGVMADAPLELSMGRPTYAGPDLGGGRGLAGRGVNITVNARTDADAREIARETAWQAKVAGL